MTDLRTAAQQALEAMSSFESGTNGLYEGEFAEEIAALRAALAEEAMQRKPLAEWQINDLMADIDPEDVDSWSFRQGVYAAEKHHGVRP